MVVVPWALSNVIAGSPQVFEPYIHLTKYMAEYRNYWWQHGREAESDPGIRRPDPLPRPYPEARSKFSDEPASDQGSNFGRIARIHTAEVMDDYVNSFNDLDLIGIRLKSWQNFFKNSS